MKTFFLLWLIMAAAVGARAQETEVRVKHLIERLRTEIPPGWTVSYEEGKDGYLKIGRDKPALADKFVINGPPEEKPRMEDIHFSFWIVPKISLAEYQRLVEENARIQTEADAIYQVLNQRRDISRKFDRFLPEKEEDKKRVARYEELKDSLHKLPEFYCEDVGLRWFEGGPGRSFGAIEPVDEGVLAELKKARAGVVKMLTPYGKEP